MNNERSHTGIEKRSDKITNKAIIFNLVNTDTMLNSDLNICRIHHGFAAIGNQLWLGHQTSSE